ncbi:MULTISPECIES: class I SAM-dependent methyltransferase [Halorhodospira]|uniref:class I SAM-dependent methyltransferase n=1 Tax=Halorhodospira TaxID=85108 RepID=UPI001EE869C9|nr:MULTISPECIES: class I SAM-dependent methyltransferase [Halorhodospira]MCG5528036.1 class I SAM-dependent methyltransferase [Halorhodospira halophila]MCG5542094.1 class I SAM-dependent methyltransferase [Halorhodospira sp. 9628]
MTRPSTKTRDEIAAAYDAPPWWYDLRGFLILTFAYNSTLGSQLRLFGTNIGDRHLDIACGSGTLLEMMLKWRRRRALPVGTVVGVDYAEAMLQGARQRFVNEPAVTLQHADAAALPFDDDSFDTVNIANSVHCFPDVDGAIQDCYRVLKAGGTLAANVLIHPRTVQPLRAIAERINRWGMRKGILHTPYTVSDIHQRFTSAGFEEISSQISGNCYNLVLRKPAC